MRNLAVGERLDVGADVLDLRFSAADGAFRSSISGMVIPVDAQGALIADFSPASASDRQDRRGISFDGKGGARIDLTALPDAVHRLIVVLYLTNQADPGDTLAKVSNGGLYVQIGDLIFNLDMQQRDDTAIIFVEIYRRNAGWRISANGQGFAFGVSAIARALNLDLPNGDAYRGAQAGPTNGVRGDLPTRDFNALASGSAFAIAPRLLLTNHHVIEDASEIVVTGVAGRGRAEVLLADAVNDLALLQMEHDASGIARFRSEGDVDLGEDVIVAGFPLQGLLGTGPQISGGNVSALMGIGNNSGVLQFTAPIGSGSSGGPILDSAGSVVGLVKAVLRNDLHEAPIAQNINFGVKSALVRSFLHSGGATATMSIARQARPRADVAREARAYLYRVSVAY
jgi:hypothetical protein